ncbi:MAG: hypothetical protein Q7S56_03060 [Nanoarchaeota archaeon]|nr:hypothetical protein [Nanoarchaeota archaeon]
MGIIRGGAVLFLSIVLLILLILTNSLLTVGLSLKYENLQPELANAIHGTLDEINFSSFINEQADNARSTCASPGNFYYTNKKTNTNVFVPCTVVESGKANVISYVSKGTNSSVAKNDIDKIYYTMLTTCQTGNYTLTEDGLNQTFSIPCDIANQGNEATVNYTLGQIAQKAYYQNYSCDYWTCIKEGNSLVIVSEKSQEYWMNKFYLALLISIAIIVLLFFMLEKKSDLLIIVGILLALSVLPILKINELIVYLLGNDMLQFLKVFETLFNQAGYVFKISLTTGVILFVIGIAIKIAGGLEAIQGFFTGDKKEKEIKDLKQKVNTLEKDKKK